MVYKPLSSNAINVEYFCAITHHIENDPAYFITIIFEKETAAIHTHLLGKFRIYGRLENFAAMLDTDLLKQLNIYVTGRYNDRINKTYSKNLYK